MLQLVCSHLFRVKSIRSDLCLLFEKPEFLSLQVQLHLELVSVLKHYLPFQPLLILLQIDLQLLELLQLF